MYVAMWAWQLRRLVMRLIGVFYASFSSVYPRNLRHLLLQWLHQQWVGDQAVAGGMRHAAGGTAGENGTRPQYKLTDKMICLSKNTITIYRKYQKLTAICHGTQTHTRRRNGKCNDCNTTNANRIQLATFNNSPISHCHSESQAEAEPQSEPQIEAKTKTKSKIASCVVIPKIDATPKPETETETAKISIKLVAILATIT